MSVCELRGTPKSLNGDWMWPWWRCCSLWISHNKVCLLMWFGILIWLHDVYHDFHVRCIRFSKHVSSYICAVIFNWHTHEADSPALSVSVWMSVLAKLSKLTLIFSDLCAHKHPLSFVNSVFMYFPCCCDNKTVCTCFKEWFAEHV